MKHYVFSTSWPSKKTICTLFDGSTTGEDRDRVRANARAVCTFCLLDYVLHICNSTVSNEAHHGVLAFIQPNAICVRMRILFLLKLKCVSLCSFLFWFHYLHCGEVVFGVWHGWVFIETETFIAIGNVFFVCSLNKIIIITPHIYTKFRKCRALADFVWFYMHSHQTFASSATISSETKNSISPVSKFTSNEINRQPSCICFSLSLSLDWISQIKYNTIRRFKLF